MFLFRHQTADSFLAHAEAVLEQHEAANNLMVGIAVRLREYGLKAQARKYLSWDDLRAEIAAGRPVIVWIIDTLSPGAPRYYNPGVGPYTVTAPYEHTMILVGYEPGKVHVVDAYTGRNQTYSLRTFMNSWKVLGKMAIFGGSPQEPQPPPVWPVGGDDGFLLHLAAGESHPDATVQDHAHGSATSSSKAFRLSRSQPAACLGVSRGWKLARAWLAVMAGCGGTMRAMVTWLRSTSTVSPWPATASRIFRVLRARSVAVMVCMAGPG